MRIVYLNSDSPYIIGKQGETNAVTLRVDVTEWVTDFPNGTGVILFTRPNKAVYPLETSTITLDGKTYLQTIVTAKENNVPGWVVLQAQWYNGETLVKSMMFSGKVLVSGNTPVDPTETVPDWVTQWMTTLQEAIDGAGNLIEAAEIINEDYENILQSVSNAEAWAKGTRSGEAVEPTDETYHNNSKYYSEQIAATYEDVEAWANGTRDGVDIGSGDPAYQKNGKYYNTQAAASASAAAASASEAMTDTPEGYANVVASISPTYDGTKTYAVGAYCLNGGKLYRCTTAITEAEATFNSAHWTQVNVGSEVVDLKSAFERNSSVISANLMGVDNQENLYDGAGDWTGFTASTSEIGVSSDYYKGFPVVYSSQSWRRFYKNIPVVSGKTYTFECWLKQNTAGTALLYIADMATGAATVSPTYKQFNDTPANTWVKLSVTFTCTASGNVAPYGMSASGAFYIAKYMLVEGNAAFSLTDALNEKASVTSVSGVGDYIKYSFSATGAGQYWNPKIQKPLASGTKGKIVFDSYTGSQTLSWISLRGYNAQNEWEAIVGIMNPSRGATAEFITTKAYSKLYVQFARTSSVTDNPSGSVYIATDSNLGIANDLLGIQARHIYHVEKDGSGDFTSIVAAIAEACKYMDSIVYVGAGTYELFSNDEFGADYADYVTSDSSTWGMVLKNRVHVIGSAQTLIKATNPHWNDSRSPSAPPSVEYFSAFNTGEYGCTLENIRIEDKGIRYSIHDDRGWAGDTPYINKYINCTFVHKYGMYNDCIGGGLGENCSIEIRGCYFEADTSRSERYAYYHANNHTGITDAKGNIIVADNYFANDGSFWLNKYGDSTEMTTAFVSNNSFGSEPQVVASVGAQDNMRMIQWNNEIRT